MLIIPDIFNALLQEGIDSDSSELRLTPEMADILHDLLGEIDHTYLFLTQGSRYEIVKGYQPSAGSRFIPIIRGQFNTDPAAFPEGTCIDVRLTSSVVDEMIDQKIDGITTTPTPTTLPPTTTSVPTTTPAPTTSV